jgi:hypothetical protein
MTVSPSLTFITLPVSVVSAAKAGKARKRRAKGIIRRYFEFFRRM